MNGSLFSLLPRSHRHMGTVIALVVAIALLFLLPHILSTFHTFVATRILILAVFAMALNVVFGQGGLPSLGHAAFFGIGGYVVALGLVEWGWSFTSIVLVTVTSGLIMGALVGFLTIRTEGIYLLLLTLAVGQGLWALAFELEITRGDNGIAGIDRATIPLDVASPTTFYMLVLVIVLVLVAIMWIFARSPVGRALVGARESKSRVEALGYRVWACRVGAFSLSGTISAIAGLLLVYLQGIASPELLNWTLSAEVLVMAILGGAGSFLGPALGAGVVIALEQVVSSYTERWTLVLGAVFIATMLFLPDGLTGLWAKVRRGERLENDVDLVPQPMEESV